MNDDIDDRRIVSFEQLMATYERLADRLRALATEAHLGRHRDFDELLNEDGQRCLVEQPRSGHSFIHITTNADQPKPFFAVPNERGQPGIGGGYCSAREVLNMSLGSTVARMANHYAWAECSARHGFDRHAIPKTILQEVKPEADAIAREERARLLKLLAPNWD